MDKAKLEMIALITVGAVVIGLLLTWVIMTATQKAETQQNSVSEAPSTSKVPLVVEERKWRPKAGVQPFIMGPLGNSPNETDYWNVIQRIAANLIVYVKPTTTTYWLTGLRMLFRVDESLKPQYENATLVVTLYQVLARAKKEFEFDTNLHRDGYYVAHVSEHRFAMNSATWPAHGPGNTVHSLAEFTFGTSAPLVPKHHLIGLHLEDENGEIQPMSLTAKSQSHSPQWAHTSALLNMPNVVHNGKLVDDKTLYREVLRTAMIGYSPTDHLPAVATHIQAINTGYEQIEEPSRFAEVAAVSVRAGMLSRMDSKAHYLTGNGTVILGGTCVELHLQEVEFN